jgi:hypothetical protein
MFLKKRKQKIDFLLIGAQKCGTSALAHYLGKHPEIGMANTKEVHFFDGDANFAQQPPNYTHYHKHFDFTTPGKLHGEATPIYLYWQPACQRIWQYNPNVKLIAILRNPIARAFSHWAMEVERKAETESFLDAIRHEAERLNGVQHRVFSYIDRGLYAPQILRYKALFPEHQLLFLNYEDFKTEPEGTLAKVFNFLGVDAKNYVFTADEIFKTSYPHAMPQEARDYLKAVFTADIHEVEKLLDWNCADWLE